MAIQNWSEDIILMNSSQEPEMGDELKKVTSMVRDRGDCHVVIDFSNVSIVTDSSISKLLNLKKLLADSGHQLILCSVSPLATKDIFTATDPKETFEFAEDKFVAMATLSMIS